MTYLVLGTALMTLSCLFVVYGGHAAETGRLPRWLSHSALGHGVSLVATCVLGFALTLIVNGAIEFGSTLGWLLAAAAIVAPIMLTKMVGRMLRRDRQAGTVPVTPLHPDGYRPGSAGTRVVAEVSRAA